jgi:hypothetical protein
VNEHEQAFVQEFILLHRRDRYIQLFGSSKKRSKLRDRLAHALVRDLDPRHVYDERAMPDAVAKELSRRLRRAGELEAPCYVMSEDVTLDEQDMTLGQAEKDWDTLSAIVISVLPGKLAFYRPERPSKNYVLLKG